MQVQTKLVIHDTFSGTSKPYTTMKFNEKTTVKDIADFVSAKSNHSTSSIDIRIKDKIASSVVLDDEYLKEFNPFHAKVINPSKELVEIQVYLLNHLPNSSADQEVGHSEDAVEVNSQDNTCVHQISESLPVPESLPPPLVRLSKDSKMGFFSGHNVNQHQRDQYVSDHELVKIQGEKNPSCKNSVLPLFRIWQDETKKRAPGINWSLLVYIILQVRKSGKCILYYHPIRTLVNVDNANEKLDHYEIPVENENWTSEKGAELKLMVSTIKEAKVYSCKPVRVLCELEDNNESKSSVDDKESCHLALILKKNDLIQWDTLVLSNEMDFAPRPKKKTETNSSNDVIKNIPISSIHNQPRKRQGNTNKISTKAKIQKQNDVCSMPESSKVNNISHMCHNEVLAVYHNNNSSMNTFTKSVSNVGLANHTFDNQCSTNFNALESSANENDASAKINDSIQFDGSLGFSDTNSYSTSEMSHDAFVDNIDIYQFLDDICDSLPGLQSPLNFD